MPDDVIIHVGHGKTGSSAIQSWLNSQRSALSMLGIHYPEHGEDPNGISSGNRARLLRPSSRDSKRSARMGLEFSPHALRESYDECDTLGLPTLFLSSEFFYPFMAEIANHIGSNGTIVAYIRDPVQMLESSYNQSIKRGRATAKFRLPLNPTWDTLTTLQTQAMRVVESSHLIVRPYHADLFNGGSALADMFNALSLPLPPGPAQEFRRLNSSYTLPALEFKRTMNHFNLASSLDKELDRALQMCNVGRGQYSLIAADRFGALLESALDSLDELARIPALAPLKRLRKEMAASEQATVVEQEVSDLELASVVMDLAEQSPSLLSRLRQFVSGSPSPVLPYSNFVEVLREGRS